MRDFSQYFNRALRVAVENRLIIGAYERFLWRQIKDEPKPEHIGVILDGNRRWAYEHSYPLWIGHKTGADKVEELLNWCWQLGIKSVTLYVFSTENFQRNPSEVDHIMRIAEGSFQKILTDKKLHKNEIHVKVIGRTDLLPGKLRQLIYKTEEMTKNYSKYYLTLAIAYGGRAEIVDAVKEIVQEINAGNIPHDAINEEIIEKHLYTSHLPKSDLDIVIRTSGEERLSNFLLWQSAYSELFFLDVYWPKFRRIDLWRAVRTYQSRGRRYGR